MGIFSGIKSGVKKEKYFFIGSPAIIWQSIFFYLPLLLMLVTSVVSVKDGGSFFTFTHFIEVFSKMHIFVVLKSLTLSFSIAIISFCIAYPISHFIIFYAKKYKSLFLFFLIVPFWTNFLLPSCLWTYSALRMRTFCPLLIVPAKTLPKAKKRELSLVGTIFEM